jgi:hypothetical protein
MLRFFVFYLTTASLIVVGIGIHEYSHYAAHEGLEMPALAYSDGVAEAQADLLRTERSRNAGGEVLVQQPRETTIVFFPNTFLQAAGLGLLPAQAYQDDGVLASTYFHLDHAEVGALQERGGTMPAAVVAAPLWIAALVFFGALAWALARPNLFNKALLVAFAVQLGDVGHHASAFGMDPDVFYGLSAFAILGAAILVGLRLRSLRDKQDALAKAAKKREGAGTPAMASEKPVGFAGRPSLAMPSRAMPSSYSRFRPSWDARASRASSGAFLEGRRATA